jgi:hypothetical protein
LVSLASTPSELLISAIVLRGCLSAHPIAGKEVSLIVQAGFTDLVRK